MPNWTLKLPEKVWKLIVYGIFYMIYFLRRVEYGMIDWQTLIDLLCFNYSVYYD